jgi:hypothetical protein
MQGRVADEQAKRNGVASVRAVRHIAVVYATCLFCTTHLGTNTVIERFPVGRRLAFDAAKGRLWVVCRACERWNLTPLEERWEAIEDCERRFRDTRLRVCTDNVGLARLPEGLELVRIGSPQRPEFAAWRYGDQFGRRRRRAMLSVGAGAATVAALGAGGVAYGVVTAGTAWSLLNIGSSLRALYEARRVVLRVPVGSGDRLKLRGADLVRACVSRDPSGRAPWILTLAHGSSYRLLSGPIATRGVGLVLSRINRLGGSPRQVQKAVAELEQLSDPAAYFEIVSRQPLGTRPLAQLPRVQRLALEMASHEESERRALEGELALLEEAWREAEQIAAIADDLLLPPGIEQFIQKHRRA